MIAVAPSNAIHLLFTFKAQSFLETKSFQKHISEGREEKGHSYTVEKISQGIFYFYSLTVL